VAATELPVSAEGVTKIANGFKIVTLDEPVSTDDAGTIVGELESRRDVKTAEIDQLAFSVVVVALLRFAISSSHPRFSPVDRYDGQSVIGGARTRCVVLRA
jgi:hypothetical protein